MSLLFSGNVNRIVAIFLFFFFAYNGIYAQITFNPSVESRNNYCDIVSVELTEKNTIVTIKVPKKHHKSAQISSATVICSVDDWNINEARGYYADFNDVPLRYRTKEVADEINRRRETLSKDGLLIRGLGNDQLDTSYKPIKGADSFTFTLYFDRLPVGVEKFFIRELSSTGWEWYGISISNPIPSDLHTSYNKNTIMSEIDKLKDGIVGIYEGTTNNNNRYTLGCIKMNNHYELVYLECQETQKKWRPGDVKCVLNRTATQNIFKGDWYMSNRRKNTNCYVSFNGATMSVILNGEKEEYIKLYPSVTNGFSGDPSLSDQPDTWTGTGFAISDGFVVTNYHVVENAKSIKIQGINGKFNTSFNAKIVAIDKNNDLAIIEIDDNLISFGNIPYKVKTSSSDVGESIFVLGYPLTTTMGEEIKLTTGVISSKTGFQGDVSQYQISAPVQPGNSGGPLFDEKGNVIGIVSAKHVGAENVGYAIKTSYLNNLIESSTGVSLPTNNTISSLSLSEKVKKINDFVYLISCSK